MSMRDASGCGWSGTSLAMKIAPAHVPHTGMPSATRSLSLSMIPYWLASFPIVVLSPPGMINASISSSCSGLRTSTPSTPSRSSVARCSAKSPWRPRTPARAVSGRGLPTADCKSFWGRDRVERETAHRLSESTGYFGDELGVAEMGGRFDDGLRAARRICGFEDSGADEVAFGAELHHQRGVGGRRDAPGAEQDDRELPVLGNLADELDGYPELVGLPLERVRSKLGELRHPFGDRADVCHRLDDVPCARLALAADHRRALVDPAQCFTELARAAHEGNFEGVLVDVKLQIGRRQHLALVDVVDADRFQDLRFYEVADARLGHDRDRDRVHDRVD